MNISLIFFYFFEENLKYNLKDYQEIKVQEKLDIFSVGSVPRSVIVILEDDLVDSCKPGDDVTIKYCFKKTINSNSNNLSTHALNVIYLVGLSSNAGLAYRLK